jgi:hypothetical protein
VEQGNEQLKMRLRGLGVLALGIAIVAGMYFLVGMINPLAGFIAAVVTGIVVSANLPLVVNRFVSRDRSRAKPKRSRRKK